MATRAVGLARRAHPCDAPRSLIPPRSGWGIRRTAFLLRWARQGPYPGGVGRSNGSRQPRAPNLVPPTVEGHARPAGMCAHRASVCGATGTCGPFGSFGAKCRHGGHTGHRLVGPSTRTLGRPVDSSHPRCGRTLFLGAHAVSGRMDGTRVHGGAAPGPSTGRNTPRKHRRLSAPSRGGNTRRRGRRDRSGSFRKGPRIGPTSTLGGVDFRHSASGSPASGTISARATVPSRPMSATVPIDPSASTAQPGDTNKRPSMRTCPAFGSPP